MTTDQIIHTVGVIVMVLLGVIGWFARESFKDVKKGQTDLKDAVKETNISVTSVATSVQLLTREVLEKFGKHEADIRELQTDMENLKAGNIRKMR